MVTAGGRFCLSKLVVAAAAWCASCRCCWSTFWWSLGTFVAPGRCFSSLLQVAAGHYRTLLLVAVAGHCSSRSLVTVPWTGRCCSPVAVRCWSLLGSGAGRCFWPLLLVTAAGRCRKSLVPFAVAGCYCWSRLLALLLVTAGDLVF